jgi:tRNA nucleotidyltransferase/poly(A) polymerase
VSLASSAPLDRLFERFPELASVAAAIGSVRTDARPDGTPSYLVGGLPRDMALGLDGNDLDITSPLRPEEFREAVNAAGLDASVYDIGEVHGTTGVAFERPDGSQVIVEHTTHRAESYEPGSRIPTVTMGDSLEADLARRDFTVNAVAIDLGSGEWVDPFGGLDDLANGVLRTPGDDPYRTFSEDPLRIVRMVRFTARSEGGLRPNMSTLVAARRCAPRLEIVAPERIQAEVAKTLSSGTGATAAALEVAWQAGIRDVMFDKLGDRLKFPTDLLPAGPDASPDSALAGLVFASSDPEGALRRLKFPNAQARPALAAAAAGRELSDVSTEDLTPEFARSMLRRHGFEACQEARQLARIPGVGRGVFGAMAVELVCSDVFDDADGFATKPLPVDGHDAVEAGLKGRAVGEALAAVEKAMCRQTDLTRAEALAILASR